MTKEKYFSVDVSNDIHIVNLHDTEEQARKSCLDCANEAYEFASDLDEFENYVEHDLPYAVYGVILGRAKSDTRPLTNDELESGYYDEQSHVIEPPELIKVNNFNNWISVDDRLPDDGQEVLIVWNGETRIAIADLVTGNGALFSFRFEALDEEEWSAIYRYSGEIKFWQPLPPPPITND